MKQLIPFILFATSFMYSNPILAQKLDKGDLLFKTNAEENALFVINGILFDDAESIVVQPKLDSIDINKIVSIEVIKTAKLTSLRKDIIIINYAVDLPFEQVQSTLNEIIPKFTDIYYGFSSHIYTNAKDSILYVNENKIHHTEAKDIINTIDARSIAFIFEKTGEQSIEHHGQNAKNGVVYIWTKGHL